MSFLLKTSNNFLNLSFINSLMDTSISYPTPTQFQTPSQFDFGSTGAGHF